MSASDDFTAQIRVWLKDHVLACAFIETLYEILHVVDDLTDRDKAIATAQMHQAFWHALITLPRNAFYVEHFALLNGTLQTAILNWHAANRMEVTEAANAKEVAYVLRSSYNDLITTCAWIIGGDEWAQKVAYECRLRVAKEGFQTYHDSLKNEHRTSMVTEG
jgi:hypothetical protein